MTNKNEQILQLLKNGKSYSEIQSLLKVSPSKIAQIKRKNDLQKPNITTTTGSSSNTTTTDDNSVSLINTNDPALLLELRKIELAHEEKLLKLNMEEKDRERAFESKKLSLSSSNYQEDVLQLQNKISKLEEELSELSNTENDEYFSNTLHSEEEVEDENYPLAEELSSEFREFIIAFLELEDTTMDKEEIQEQLDQIEHLSTEIGNAYDEAAIDIEESNEKQILDEAKNDLEEFITEIENSYFSTTVRYSFSDEWREDLRDVL